MALAFAGTAAVQTSSAEPAPDEVSAPRSPAAMRMLGSGQLKANQVEVSGPAGAWTPNGGRFDVFQTFGDILAHRFWTAGAGWSDWFNLGAPAAGIASDPTATWATDTSRLDVFVTGSDFHLYQLTFGASGWGAWTDLGGLLISGPSATSSVGRIDVFVIGTDNRLYQKTWLGSAWTDWAAFAEPGALIGSAPSATWVPAGGRLDVFVRGEIDGGLYQLTWTAAGGWGGWVGLGGVLNSAPSAAWTQGGGRIDVFVIGTDNRLYQKTWISSFGWTGWAAFNPPAVGTGLVLGPSVAWVPDGSRVDVLVTAQDGHVYQLAWSAGSGWSDWADLD